MGVSIKRNDDLKRIINDKKIECKNQSVNAIMRKSIWEHYANELDLQNIEIDVSKEDAKKIWDKLSPHMPVYSLFQSDRKNSDGDSEVQDPLKEAVILSISLDTFSTQNPKLLGNQLFEMGQISMKRSGMDICPISGVA